MKHSIALAVLLLTPGLSAAQDRTPMDRTTDRVAEALRKGIVEEETNRDLNAAIRSYQAVLSIYEGDRQSAATAVFRIAECYRKLGRSKDAIASYTRVVRDFADQTRLADQSRSALAKLAGPAGASAADARGQYRALLEQEIQLFRKQVDLVQKQYELGAKSAQDINQAQAALAKQQGRMAAFDAGLVPQAPVVASIQNAVAARAKYRDLLQMEVDYAGKELDAMQKRFELGTAQPQDIVDAQIRVIEAKVAVAAFDAGLAPSPTEGLGRARR